MFVNSELEVWAQNWSCLTFVDEITVKFRDTFLKKTQKNANCEFGQELSSHS